MGRIQETHNRAAQRKHRVRARIRGSASQPRLVVTISNRQVYAQLVDDNSQRTLASSSSLKQAAGSMSEKAKVAGQDLAKKALKANIRTVVLDRGARLYHGRVKELADAARQAGLEF